MAKRVVVADNDDEWLQLIILDLGLEGHEVVGTATSGDTAIAECEAQQPDVLVVDHRMPPGQTGLSVATYLSETMPELQVIVFSNYEDPALMHAVEAQGATFVLKTNLRALRRAVNEI